MAVTFIWKKQFALLITMAIILGLGLAVGFFLHDRLVDSDDKNATNQGQTLKKRPTNFNSTSRNMNIQMPSLAFPTSKPSVSAPPSSATKNTIKK